MTHAVPLDDPLWQAATDAYGHVDTAPRLQTLSGAWNDELAETLLFSALLHQDSVYPATFLSLPQVIALHDSAPEDKRALIAAFLGAVALHGQLPRTSDGVSLAPGDPFRATPIGQRAHDIFIACLPQIAPLCEAAYRAEPFCQHASGLAAATGEPRLALWLEARDNGSLVCPACDADSEWLLFGNDLALYRGGFSLEDWRAGRPATAASIAVRASEPPEVTALRARLGPTDPTTDALLMNYGATVTCPACGWQGPPPAPRL